MTTLRQIITDSLRESGIISLGDEPEADSFQEGLRRLQVLIKSLVGHELGEPLKTLNYGRYNIEEPNAISRDVSSVINSSYVPANTRLIFNISAATTIDLPPNPKDGARIAVIDNAGNFGTYNVTLDGNGRKIEDSATVTLNTNGLTREWFYRADTGNWVRVQDLVAESESPFPQEFDDYLTILLAIRLNPRYNAETKPETLEMLNRAKRQFRARYKQETEMEVEEALLRLSNYYSMFSSTTTDRFNNGID